MERRLNFPLKAEHETSQRFYSFAPSTRALDEHFMD